MQPLTVLIPSRLYKHGIFKNVVFKISQVSTTRFTPELISDLKLCHAEMSFLCLHACVFDFEGDAQVLSSPMLSCD